MMIGPVDDRENASMISARNVAAPAASEAATANTTRELLTRITLLTCPVPGTRPPLKRLPDAEVQRPPAFQPARRQPGGPS